MRAWQGVLFNCCGVYGRLYQNPKTKLWCGHCPRCLKAVSLAVIPKV